MSTLAEAVAKNPTAVARAFGEMIAGYRRKLGDWERERPLTKAETEAVAKQVTRAERAADTLAGLAAAEHNRETRELAEAGAQREADDDALFRWLDPATSAEAEAAAHRAFESVDEPDDDEALWEQWSQYG